MAKAVPQTNKSTSCRVALIFQGGHYIINRMPASGPNQIMYRIGDQNFQDLPELLGFYKLHYLDTTPLRRPAKKIFERVICKFDFKAGVCFNYEIRPKFLP